jgi:hypothetical protein
MKPVNLFVIIISIASIAAAAAIFFVFNRENSVTVSINPEPAIQASPTAEVVLEPEPPKPVFSPPEIVKAVYVTSWSASKESYIEYLINLARDTEINGVVIDVKDWSGYIAYDTALPEVEKYKAKSVRIKDIGSLVQRLRQEGIYSIARITVFQDPVLARARPDLAVRSESGPSSLWLDDSGLAWIDPAAKESWDYNIAIAREVLALGFDEINFDYIRFPSDGNLRDMSFPLWDGEVPKHSVIREFFGYLRQELPEAKLSVDLFGLSTVNTDDLGIGQVIEDAFEYFDYICPMVYPSHYAYGFLGYQNPAAYPYEVVEYSMEKALARLAVFNQSKEIKARLRPWLQDFNLGAVYDPAMVRSEIAAVYDAAKDNFSGFMLWNSSNVYTTKALEPFYSE